MEIFKIFLWGRWSGHKISESGFNELKKYLFHIKKAFLEHEICFIFENKLNFKEAYLFDRIAAVGPESQYGDRCKWKRVRIMSIYR